jgi:Ser/Thr protein kinase RdoA (MazF antagonist)
VTQPRGAALPRQLQDATRVSAAQQKLNELLRGCSQTIVHGDEHLGNLYLDSDGNAGFIDWCARREPWVIGFTYFLISTLDALDRRRWEEPLLQYYLSRLAHHGAQPPSFAEAWLLHRCTTLYPMLTWFNNSAKWQPESVNTRNCMRAALAVIDHNVLDLLGA